MIPFMSDDLETMIREIMSRFIKNSVMNDLRNTYKLSKSEIKESDLLPYQKVDIGFSATKLLKELSTGKKVSERAQMDFRMQARKCMMVLVNKLLAKCPLKSSLIRNSKCLNPVNMAENSRETCCKQFNAVLTTLVDAKRFDERKCDEANRQYKNFLDITVVSQKTLFSGYSNTQMRLDEFFSTFMRSGANNEMWTAVKFILVLSHGQATVERGFSINSKLMVENKKSETYVAQRLVIDAINRAGGVDKLEITNEMILDVKNARQKYEQHLADNKKVPQCQENTRKRKALDDFNEEKKRLRVDIDSLQTSAEQAAEKAEQFGKREFFVLFNTYRKAIKDKTAQLDDVQAKIDGFK